MATLGPYQTQSRTETVSADKLSPSDFTNTRNDEPRGLIGNCTLRTNHKGQVTDDMKIFARRLIDRIERVVPGKGERAAWYNRILMTNQASIIPRRPLQSNGFLSDCFLDLAVSKKGTSMLERDLRHDYLKRTTRLEL